MDAMPTAGQPQVPGFEVLREIGRGATSRVYLARQEALQRDVALKVITTLGERGRRRALRLFREARLAGALDHANIVRGIDAGEQKDYCWFAMEYVPGGTLLDAMERSEGRLDPERVARIGIQLLSALDHTHDRGVVHRDLKPANVLVDVEGRAHLLDLGLARHTADTKLTQEGGTLGTPQYMAPEQAREARLVDARSDLFSLGATLYHALTGQAPFEAETVANVLTRLLYEEAEAPSNLVPDLPPAWDLFFHRALAKEPKDRYQAAVEMARDLRAVSRGATPALRRPEVAERGRRTLIAATSAGVLLLVAALVLWQVIGDGKPEERTNDEGESTEAPDAVDPVRRAWRSFAARLEAADLEALSPTALGGLLLEAPDAIPDAAARARLSGLQDRLVQTWTEALGEERTSALGAFEARELTPEALERFLHPRFPASATPPPLATRLTTVAEKEREQREAAVDAARERLANALRSSLDAVAATMRANPNEEEGSAVGRRLDAALAEVGDPDLLDAPRRDRLMQHRRRLLADAARAPRALYERDRKQAEGLVAEGRFVEALEAIDRLEKRHAGETTALALGADLRGVIERRSSSLQTEARTLCDQLTRRTHDPLLRDEWRRRRDAIAAGLGRLPDPTRVPGLTDVVREARGVHRLLEAALALEEALSDAARQATQDGATEPLLLARRDEGTRRPWRLLGLDAAGTTLSVRRPSDGFTQDWRLDELDPASRLVVLEAGRLPSDPLARAAFAYLHGDDDLAESLLPSEDPPEAGLATLIASVRASQEAWVKSRATEEEREAARQLQRLRRALVREDLRAIREASEKLETLRRRHKTKAFFREEAREITGRLRAARERLEEARSELAARERFGFTRFERATGVGVIEIPVPRAGAHPLLTVPPGTVEILGGVRIDPGKEAWRTPPWKLVPWKLALPTEGVKRARLQFSVRFPGPEPPAALQVSLFDLGFLGISHLKESLQYRGEALHGLERDLFSHTAYQRVAAWVGEFKKPPRGLPTKGSPFLVKTGETLIVSMEIEPGRGQGSLRVGSNNIPLPRGGRPRATREGIEIRGFPFFELSNIFVEVETDL